MTSKYDYITAEECRNLFEESTNFSKTLFDITTSCRRESRNGHTSRIMKDFLPEFTEDAKKQMVDELLKLGYNIHIFEEVCINYKYNCIKISWFPENK